MDRILVAAAAICPVPGEALADCCTWAGAVIRVAAQVPDPYRSDREPKTWWAEVNVLDPAFPWSYPAAVRAWPGVFRSPVFATIDGFHPGHWYAVQGWKRLGTEPDRVVPGQSSGHAFLLKVEEGGAVIVDSSRSTGRRASRVPWPKDYEPTWTLRPAAELLAKWTAFRATRIVLPELP